VRLPFSYGFQNGPLLTKRAVFCCVHRAGFEKMTLKRAIALGFFRNLFELEQVANIGFDRRASVRPIGSVRAGLGGN